MGRVSLPAELIQHGGIGQGKSLAQGVRQILGPGERLMYSLARLVWIAKVPQGVRRMGEANHPMVKRQGVVLLGGGKGNRLFQVSAGRSKFPQI